LIDDPQTPTTGNLVIPDDTSVSYGTINYTTGAFNLNFPTAPANGAAINSQTIPMQPSRPQSVLFYDGKFTVRPLPDQPYKITMDVFVRPTELLSSTDEPKLQEWWRYVAYGASLQCFQDRMDMESIQNIMPEFKNKEMLNPKTYDCPANKPKISYYIYQ